MMYSLQDYFTELLSVIPEPHTVIFDELFVRPFVLHFLNRGYGNLDQTPSLIASNEQPIEGQIRTLTELEQTLYRYDYYHRRESKPISPLKK